MKPKLLIKALLAFVLTLTVLCGSGVIMEKTGVVLVQAVYACSANGGGGC